jgi:hypothetical protein
VFSISQSILHLLVQNTYSGQAELWSKADVLQFAVCTTDEIINAPDTTTIFLQKVILTKYKLQNYFPLTESRFLVLQQELR